MVWGLFPVDPLSGEDKYYIFSKGTFRVGRKDCEIIVKKDKGVSRVHAEIIVDVMTSMEAGKTGSSNARVRDLSKYGTFINKNLVSEKRVLNKESTLGDGDMVSFGTGSATYRFSFVPLVFLVLCSEPSQMNRPLQGKLSAVGASIIGHLNQNCTHVIVEQFMEVNESLLEAVAMRKPVILGSWLEFVAEKSIRNEMPCSSSYIPSLAMEGTSVKVVDPKIRERCLEGYTFLLEPLEMYKFGCKIQKLLDIASAKSLSIDEFCSTSQGFEDVDNNRLVYVISGGSEVNRVRKLALPMVDEKDLLRAILCGHIDSSMLRAPPAVISSSCSTDETIVADSDVEGEMSKPLHEAHTIMEETTENKENAFPNNSALVSENAHSVYEEKVSVENGDDSVVIRRDKTDNSDEGTTDIIYSQDIIVRNTSIHRWSSEDASAEVNFKCFRKRHTLSGNSFNNLVPFSRFPYKDSDYGNGEVEESMKEEKKRKQLEAMAEDLFNSEKGRKRGTTGSLRGFLTRA
ncbi:hypothetical protein SAY86_025721 [Trapa natans]|uniref:FHA domain-containing protein n=1 Tax=Trapa natans TaxID=22666 RepID=A0AAN7KII2_TRANT|nr:hypothetical protein SAY86_025721 [Trapa natans]